ncbi:hypothetical protein CLV97_103102 [Planifilum fimeticola]|uniref:Uncharacterized protein n=1 Tax=Planifilum fimeticola TaxID=201975 RepID=A0A2T0LI60_9BACL|nr:hypothetical protein CLV97_103102 [Planifilum fimeticola]
MKGVLLGMYGGTSPKKTGEGNISLHPILFVYTHRVIARMQTMAPMMPQITNRMGKKLPF